MTSQQAVRLLEDTRSRIERGLINVIEPASEGPLYDAVRYALAGKGKRIRPTLTILAGSMFGADVDKTLHAALAIELFHTFTLVHDDIMDNSSLRRRRQTIHEKWDVSTAILVGDLLLGKTFDLLSRSEPPRIKEILRLHSDTVRILCEGQVLDMQFESRTHVSVKDYLLMIDQKTGQLLSSSLEMGGLFGNVSDHERSQLFSLGQKMGRAFQIQDDLLDLTASDIKWGKNIGGDLLSGKKTYLLASAIERSTGADLEWWTAIVASGKLSRESVSDARDRLEKLGVLDAARDDVLSYSQGAQDIISQMAHSDAQSALSCLLESLQTRSY